MDTLRAVSAAEDPHDALCRSARTYADQLGLRNHTVELMVDEPRDPAALMECELATGRAHIRLRVRGDFWSFPEQERRLALTHELIHPHFQRLTERTESVFRENIGGIAFRVFWLGFTGDVEELVDRLASLLAPTMPELE